MPKDQSKHSVIYVRNVTPEMKSDLQNIARNKGKTVTGMVRSILRKEIDNTPPELKKPTD